MADQSELHTSPRLAGYESWLYQMPRLDSTGDVFVSIPLTGHTDLYGQIPTRWLVAVGDVSARGEAASRLKDTLETGVIRLAGTMTDPAAILNALNSDLLDPDRFACLLVAVIDSEHHELTLASAGHAPPFFRYADRRTELLGVSMTGFPLWIDPSHSYGNVTVPFGPGEIVILHSNGVTSWIDHQNNLFDFSSLRQAITHARGDARSVGQSILEAINRLLPGRAQTDDITLLCLGRIAPTSKRD